MSDSKHLTDKWYQKAHSHLQQLEDDRDGLSLTTELDPTNSNLLITSHNTVFQHTEFAPVEALIDPRYQQENNDHYEALKTLYRDNPTRKSSPPTFPLFYSGRYKSVLTPGDILSINTGLIVKHRKSPVVTQTVGRSIPLGLLSGSNELYRKNVILLGGTRPLDLDNDIREIRLILKNESRSSFTINPFDHVGDLRIIDALFTHFTIS